MAAVYKDVRVEESLRVKIGEAKNLPASSFSGSSRNTCCAIKIDSEEIFRTKTVEKSANPFFAAEFQGEIPKKFRCLSFYVYEVGHKNKVLGKVTLKKEELYKYHQKEHWFPLTYQDGNTEVQGKVQVEIKFDEYLTPSSDMSHRMAVRVLECSDLTVINGSCNPYAVVTLSYGKSKAKEVKKTAVKKKTICPQFDETFYFSIDNKGQNQEKNSYVFDDFMSGELSISLFHDDSKVSREVLGNIFKGCFLGEIKISVSDIDSTQPHKAWYCLQAKEQNRANEQSLGSIRLRISYTADYVFPSKYYDGLRNLILKSAETKPFTSSAVFILGEIVNHSKTAVRENAAQPLVKLFLHHGRLVPLIHALGDWEMSNTADPNTLFRGNSLLTKMVDELMKLIGLPYLHDTLKSFVDQVVTEARPCEIDPSRLKEGEDLETNKANLKVYVDDAINIIVSSGLVCPSSMRDVFSTLKSRAMLNYPDNIAVRYHAVTSFIFLRFFTAAIMGPNLFDLYSDTLDPSVQRTFTLLSKAISGLVSLVCSKSNNVTTKEEYMAPLFEMFPKSVQSDIIMFLDIISSSSGPYFKGIEAPILLKEGFLIKRAQGRKRFGLLNFKKRFFKLTNQTLSYCKNKGDKLLFEIPVTDILAVERLEEESFKMKYMFQVVHAQRALYIQASNCVEEKEWLDILTKVCKSNKDRLKSYHPAAFINNHWLCCKVTDPSMPGCKPVTGGLPLNDILGEIDSDREVEKIHSLFLSAIEMLDALQGFVDEEVVSDEACGSQVVYSGDVDARSSGLGSNIEDPASCFVTIAEIQRCIITLEQEHIQYMRSVQSRTVIGSIDTPIGDDSTADLVRNMNRSSERLSRHGSRSSNASIISRWSFRGSHSRGGSFREQSSGKGEGDGVKKSQSGDVIALPQNLGTELAGHTMKTTSCDLVSVDPDGMEYTDRTRAVCDDSRREKDIWIINDGNGNAQDDGRPFSVDIVHSVGHNEDTTPTDVRGQDLRNCLHSTVVCNGDHTYSCISHNGSVVDSENGASDGCGACLHQNSGLSHGTSSGQSVGMLRTSLDSQDTVTDTSGPESLQNSVHPCISKSSLVSAAWTESTSDISSGVAVDGVFENSATHYISSSNGKYSSNSEIVTGLECSQNNEDLATSAKVPSVSEIVTAAVNSENLEGIHQSSTHSDRYDSGQDVHGLYPESRDDFQNLSSDILSPVSSSLSGSRCREAPLSSSCKQQILSGTDSSFKAVTETQVEASQQGIPHSVIQKREITKGQNEQIFEQIRQSASGLADQQIEQNWFKSEQIEHNTHGIPVEEIGPNADSFPVEQIGPNSHVSSEHTISSDCSVTSRLTGLIANHVTNEQIETNAQCIIHEQIGQNAQNSTGNQSGPAPSATSEETGARTDCVASDFCTADLASSQGDFAASVTDITRCLPLDPALSCKHSVHCPAPEQSVLGKITQSNGSLSLFLPVSVTDGSPEEASHQSVVFI